MAGIFSLFMLIGSILFKLLIKLRLGIPALYIGLMCTAWHDWYMANEMLGNVLFFGLLVCVMASWIVTLTRFVRERYA